MSEGLISSTPTGQVLNTVALPMGILMVGLGSVLLFVAFHNLSPEIRTFGDFMGHLADGFRAGAVP